MARSAQGGREEEGDPKNALEVGFREAFDSLLPLPCSACSTFSFMELNLMFSLHLEAILNTLRLAARRGPFSLIAVPVVLIVVHDVDELGPLTSQSSTLGRLP